MTSSSYNPRQFVFVYKGKLDVCKFNTEKRCGLAGNLLLRCFEGHPAHNFVVDNDTMVHVDMPTGVVEFGCKIMDVSPTEEAKLVEYLSGAVAKINSLDEQAFADFGC